MAALAESTGLEPFSLAGLPMPVKIQLAEPMSDAELIAFSRCNRPFQIERNATGELEVMSPVAYDGGEREQFVAGELYVRGRQHGGHTFSPNTGFTLPDGSVRSPDASWVSDAGANHLSVADRRGFAPLCPEFVVEVLSESDSRPALEAKMEMWIANGTLLAWLIDPFAATLTIYRPGQAPTHLKRPDWVEADTTVPGFRLETARLWAN